MNKVLIVEDDKIFGGKLAKKLGQNGFEANWVDNGVDAKQKIEKEKFVGIFLDLNLGKHSKIHGEGLLNEFKGKLNCPIIVMTAHDDRIPQLFDYDIYTIFRKPVEVSLLVYSIKKGIEFYYIANELESYKKIYSKKPKKVLNITSIITLVLLISTLVTVYFTNSENVILPLFLTLVILVQIIGGKNLNELQFQFQSLLLKIKTNSKSS